MPAQPVPLVSQLFSARPGDGVGGARDPLRYGIVGHGWRADFYLRLARQAPERFVCAGVVTRRAEVGDRLEADWGVPTVRRTEDLITSVQPEVVVTCVPRAVCPEILENLVSLDTAVLAETPPASDAAALRRLWDAVGGSDLIQVAEQHPFLPIMAALRELIDQGLLGQISSAHISWTHDYHAMSLLRCLLGVGAQSARVTAVSTAVRLLAGPDREGWPRVPAIEDVGHTLAILEVAGRTGVYDFTEGQWFNPLRSRHLIVRGSRGEVVGDRVTWGGDNGRPMSTPVVRQQSGLDGNLQGSDLETLSWAREILYRNPYPGARLSDEEIAIATCLEATGMWSRGEGPPPYPLAHACQDLWLSLHVHEAARSGETVHLDVEAWGDAVQAAGQLDTP